MDPALAGLIEAVALDALKILGPAIVAAVATYKATKVQYELKLKELERSQSFKARENLLEHYRQQKSRVDEVYNSLSNTLGQILGMASSASLESASKIDDFTSTMVGVADMYVGMAPFDIRMTLRDMASLNLTQEEEYRKLESYLDQASRLDVTREFEQLKNNIYTLLEIYGFLGRCNHLMLEKQIHSLFEGYVEHA